MNGLGWFLSWQIDGWALLGLVASWCLAYLFWRPLPRSFYPSFGFSRVVEAQSFRSRLIALPFWLKSLALFLWTVAWLDPHQMVTPEPFSKKMSPASQAGTALYLLIDQSGSMGGSLDQSSTSKWAAIQQALVPFIQDQPQDLIGLLSFARTPRLISPLTLDHTFLIHALQQLTPVDSPEENGTAIGYALYKASYLVKTLQQALSHAPKMAYHFTANPRILLITDGFQDPNYLDYGNALRTLELNEALEQLLQEKIHLDIILLQTPSKEFTLQKKHLEEMSVKTGGLFAVVHTSGQLTSALKKIQGFHLEFPTTGTPPKRKNSLFPIFLVFGLVSYLSGICIEILYLRKVP